jgi:hypothetical protein
MSDEEFLKIILEDLTYDAKSAYSEEKIRRESKKWKGKEVTNRIKIEGFSNIAREIANKPFDTHALITIDGHRQSNVLVNLLRRTFSISKKRITKLGPTSSEYQDIQNLSQDRDIIIRPRNISMPDTFRPGKRFSKIMLIHVTG